MIKTLSEQLCTLIQKTLQENLLAIYVHGSLAMGCFVKGKSDVDLLIVVADELTPIQKRLFVDLTMTWEQAHLTGKGLEYHILLLREVQNFRYPTPFLLHYSAAYRERYQKDGTYLCADGTDCDLAAHLMVTYERGIPLYGPPLKELAPPVDPSCYFDSIWHDIKDSREEIGSDPVYFVLNLCRVYFYVAEGVVSSKQEAGKWALQVLEDVDRGLIADALRGYQTEPSVFHWEEQCLVQFADVVLKRIEHLHAQIKK